MKTENKSYSKEKAILAVVGTMGAVVFFACLIFHFTPLGMAKFLADFAAHHYFVFGFLSFLVATGCYRLYTLWDDQIDKRYQKRHPVFKVAKENKVFDK